MVAQGYQSVRLETASFMTSAIRLYRGFGFVEMPPFRPPLGNLQAMSVFMECDLAGFRAKVR
jgi:ribosomal protein S18 acetylase RimI-like enzyme